jgi:hypothetical protein
MITYSATLSCDGANCQAMTSGDPSAQYYRTAVEAYDEAKALGWTRRFKDAERRYEAWLCPECSGKDKKK